MPFVEEPPPYIPAAGQKSAAATAGGTSVDPKKKKNQNAYHLAFEDILLGNLSYVGPYCVRWDLCQPVST